MGTKSPCGRPTKYKPEYCDEIVEYFNKEPYFEREIVKTDKKGNTYEAYEFVANDLPLFGKFASDIGVTHDTLLEWVKVHPEFSLAYKKAKTLQEHMLAINGLKGLYSTPFAIFTAKNILGWRDQQDIKHSGDKEHPVGMLLMCPPENKDEQK
jgi:hypothetical protein